MEFTQAAYPTVRFTEEILVKCPNCEDIGIVKTQLGQFNIPYPTNYKTRFNCNHCGLKKDGNSEWFGYFQASIAQNCGFCGSALNYDFEPTKEPFKNSSVKCEACKKEKVYELKWLRYKKDKPRDPFFGLELWLQTTIKSNILWLYNLEHLNYLRTYVQAKLRKDDKRHKYSMITNLPQWIKAAKNRDLIVKKLNKLEKELKTKTEIDHL